MKTWIRPTRFFDAVMRASVEAGEIQEFSGALVMGWQSAMTSLHPPLAAGMLSV